jgi:hypothetical protein
MFEDPVGPLAAYRIPKFNTPVGDGDLLWKNLTAGDGKKKIEYLQIIVELDFLMVNDGQGNESKYALDKD